MKTKMVNEYLDKEKKLAAQEKLLAKHKWQCMCPTCTEQAINSHLLQRHGILDNVVEQGHLYELKIEDYFKWHTNDPVCFKKVGLQQAISYPLFCSKHDTELFRSIEGETIDFDDYVSQLLFSYRGICSEIRKKEFVQLRSEAWDDNDIKDSSLKGTEKGLSDLKYYKFLFEKELSCPNHKFCFRHFTYPLIPVYASGSASYEPVNYENALSVENALKKKTWDAFFINLIPQKSTLEIIIGYNKNHVNSDLCYYVDSWQGLTLEQLQVKLTDLFVARLEMWGMSPSLYKNLSEERKELFLDNLRKVHSSFSYDIRNELEFNLFS